MGGYHGSNEQSHVLEVILLNELDKWEREGVWWLGGVYHGSDEQTNVKTAVWQKLKLTDYKEEGNIHQEGWGLGV